MTAYVFDGVMEIWYVPTISSVTAPTQTEVRAGTNLTHAVTKDGFNTSPTTNKVDAGDMSTTFDASLVGTQSLNLSVKAKREKPVNAAWTAFHTYGQNGYIVVAPYGFASHTSTADGTPTTGDKIDVYPVQNGAPSPSPSAANTQQTFVYELGVTSQYALEVAIA